MMIEESICPFCQNENACMAKTSQSCWCNNVDIPEQLLKLVPEQYKNKQCICNNCIAFFKNDPLKFKQTKLR